MILFVSNMTSYPWGGSEELWTRTAKLIAGRGVRVAASVHGWPQLDRRMIELSRNGIDVRPRPVRPSLLGLARRYLTGQAEIALDIKRSFGRASPCLVVISNAFGMPPIDIIETCIERGWPFVLVTHSSLPAWWPSGEMAARMRKGLASARRCFFVAEANRTLASKQLAYDFDGAEVVRNPLIIDVDSPFPWPADGIGDGLRMACVARLSAEKGQDILLEVLATPRWIARRWRLTLYGNGPTQDILERLAERLGLRERVVFAGHVDVKRIWRENHVLVMPSRCEGMPLAIVEAMSCGRPVVATNVGGISELVRDGQTGFLAVAPAIECFDEALERMWRQRDALQEVGKMAAVSVREFLPDDPVEIFASKLLDLAGLAE